MYRGVGDLGVERLGTEGVRLAVQFLHEEIEPTTDRLRAREAGTHLGDMCVEAVKFLGNVALLRQQDDLLLDTLLVDLFAQFGETRRQSLA